MRGVRAMTESKKKKDANNSANDAEPSGSEDKKEHIEEEKKGILTGAAGQIESGAGAIGRKVSEFAGKSTETAGEVYETVKLRLNTIYKAGLKWVDELSQTAQDYVDRYRYNSEMKNLSEERDSLTTELGKKAYANHKIKETTIDNLFRHNEIAALVSRIDTLDKEIVETGKKLEKKK
jgi:hypothetical protein